MSRLDTLHRALSLAVLAVPTVAQEPVPARSGPLDYPRDAQRVVARVGGRDVVFEDLVRHVTERHAPDFARLLASPEGKGYLEGNSNLPSDWVRQYADILALQDECERRGWSTEDVEPLLAASLQRGFEAYLERETGAGRITGHLTEEVMNIRLARYQLEHGLETEVAGWLDYLVPGEFTDDQARAYFNGHPREFGGRVTFAHVLVQDRDPVTLRLLEGDARAAAMAKVADIEERLAADGSNFEEVAARYSDDRRTAARGGVFENVARFDPRLPAILCRTAWHLRDGEWTGPVTSQFGQHFVKRVSTTQQHFLLYAPATRPIAEEHLRKDLQEEVLFGLRERLGVTLRY